MGSRWCHTAVLAQTHWNTRCQFGAIRDDDSTDRLTDAFCTQTPIALARFVVVCFLAVLPLRDKTMEGESKWRAAFMINSFLVIRYFLQWMWLPFSSSLGCFHRLNWILPPRFSLKLLDEHKTNTVTVACQRGHSLELILERKLLSAYFSWLISEELRGPQPLRCRCWQPLYLSGEDFLCLEQRMRTYVDKHNNSKAKQSTQDVQWHRWTRCLRNISMQNLTCPVFLSEAISTVHNPVKHIIIRMDGRSILDSPWH